jgi:hypothetical protein
MSSERRLFETSAIRKSGAKEMPEDNFHMIDAPEFWTDLLLTAEAISEFLYGTREKARSVFHVASSSNTLPIFHFGSRLAARKSVIRATFWAQERRAFRDQKEEDLVRLGVLLVQLGTIIRTAYAEPSAPREAELWMLLLSETARTIDRVVTSK